MNIIIVGCGNVGLETARLLGANHRLLLISRSLSAEVEAFVANQPNASFVKTDATDMASLERALKSGGDRFQCIDVLISTVGAPGSASALDEFERYKDDFDLNFFGNLVPIKAVLKRMLAQRSGKIVAISSTSGVHTYPGWGAYAPAKWALTNFCRTLRREVGPHGISVDIVFPRTIRNQRSKTFLNDAGVEPQQVARKIVEVLTGAKGTDRFVPGRHELLRPLERVFPQILDRKAGLRRERRPQFCSPPVRRALINEATSTLGLELARRYATTAESLWLVGSDEAALSMVEEDVRRSSQCAVRTIPLRESDAEAMPRLIGLTGQVDLIVNCSVPSIPGELAAVPLDACERSLAASFFAPLRLLTAYLRRDMLPRKIINVLSMCVVTGRPRHGCFSAGQAALWAQTRALRRTVGNHVQVMEALLPMQVEGPAGGQSNSRAITCEAAGRIHNAERCGREIVVFPLRSRISMYLDAICPRVFT